MQTSHPSEMSTLDIRSSSSNASTSSLSSSSKAAFALPCFASQPAGSSANSFTSSFSSPSAVALSLPLLVWLSASPFRLPGLVSASVPHPAYSSALLFTPLYHHASRTSPAPSFPLSFSGTFKWTRSSNSPWPLS